MDYWNWNRRYYKISNNKAMRNFAKSLLKNRMINKRLDIDMISHKHDVFINLLWNVKLKILWGNDILTQFTNNHGLFPYYFREFNVKDSSWSCPLCGDKSAGNNLNYLLYNLCWIKSHRDKKMSKSTNVGEHKRIHQACWRKINSHCLGRGTERDLRNYTLDYCQKLIYIVNIYYFHITHYPTLGMKFVFFLLKQICKGLMRRVNKVAFKIYIPHGIYDHMFLTNCREDPRPGLCALVSHIKHCANAA